MALDKVVDSAVLDAGMKSVADAIRAKAGTTDLLAWPDGFKAAVEGIQTGGGGGDEGCQFLRLRRDAGCILHTGRSTGIDSSAGWPYT